MYSVRTKSDGEILEGTLTLFSVPGNPKQVRVDNGREFKNEGFIRVMREMECSFRSCTVGHHQSQGYIEQPRWSMKPHNTLKKRSRA